jgi:hypothetical protein
MIRKLGCSIVLLASAAMLPSAQAQKVLPGTLASTAAPEPSEGDSSSTVDSTSSSSSDARRPISAKERIQWVVKTTVGPEGVAGEVVGAGFGTLFNSPKAYGPHWEGFGDRLGMSVAGNLVSGSMEAGFGAIWGEDPRYFREPGASFGHRLGHAAKMTFTAEDRDGNMMPAYARFIAIPGSNFLSNAWRAPGDDTANRAVARTGLGFLGRFGSNTFDEFWPDMKQKLFHHGSSYQTDQAAVR